MAQFSLGNVVWFITSVWCVPQEEQWSQVSMKASSLGKHRTRNPCERGVPFSLSLDEFTRTHLSLFLCLYEETMQWQVVHRYATPIQNKVIASRESERIRDYFQVRKTHNTCSKSLEPILAFLPSPSLGYLPLAIITPQRWACWSLSTY